MKFRSFFGFTPICRAVLCAAAWLVPRPERKEWLAEWSSELWYLLDAWHRETHDSAHVIQDVTRFCLGSFADAAWLRRNNLSPASGQTLWLRSPKQCGAFLVVLAAATWLFALWEGVLRPPYTARDFMFGQLLILGIALLILPTTTTLALGEYPTTVHSPLRAARLRRWIFLGIKLALILPIVFCGTIDLAPIISSVGIEPHAMLVGYVLAFRWALIDQRRRCPMCLHLLTNPIRIGQPSHTLLDWCGTEFICSKGHGLLHVPDIPTSSYSTQRWLYLDPSGQSFLS